MARDRYEDEEDDSRSPRREDTRMSRDRLREVAMAQKIIILCILLNLATIPIRLVLDNVAPEMQLVGWLILGSYYLAVAILATVFVFKLALTIYSSGTGVLLGILTLIPCIGLIVLLVINSKATGILQKHGVRVGLLGARMSDL
jgi:hypothetical protein